MQPTGRPTNQPSGQPTRKPSGQPSSQPSRQPTAQPSVQPTGQPSSQPSAQPSERPTMQPTSRPTAQPSRKPSGQPSAQPSGQPSSQPSQQPTEKPTVQPSMQPSAQPTMQPSLRPSCQPTSTPTRPTGQPSGQPTRQPTSRPTSPSGQPTTQPTGQPSGQPSMRPTGRPTGQPSMRPSGQPTILPSSQPTGQPSCRPSGQPSNKPTGQPSGQPSRLPSGQPTVLPSSYPTGQPSRQPTGQPTRQPTSKPSRQPSSKPTGQPTLMPSSALQTLVSFNVTVDLSVNNGYETYFKENTGGARDRFFAAVETLLGRFKPEYFYVAPSSDLATPSPSAAPTISLSPTGQPSRQPTSQPTMHPTNKGAPSHRRLDNYATVPASFPKLNGATELADAHRKLQSPTVTLTFTLNIIAEYFLNVHNMNFGVAEVAYQAVKAKLASTAFTESLTKTSSPTHLTFVQGVATSFSSYTFKILHSAKPTGTPTSNPTKMFCHAGYYHDSYEPRCWPCAPGEFSQKGAYVCQNCTAGQMSHGAAPQCTDCPINEYSSHPRSTSCHNCTWPYTTIFRKSTWCDGVGINASNPQAYGLVGVLVAFYLLLLGSPGFFPAHGKGDKNNPVYMTPKEWTIQTLTFFAFTVMPASDVLSDFLYIISTTFSSVPLFLAAFIFLVMPNTLLFINLYDLGGEDMNFYERPMYPAGLVWVKPHESATDGTYVWLGVRIIDHIWYPVSYGKGRKGERSEQSEFLSWYKPDRIEAMRDALGLERALMFVELIIAWVISIVVQLPGFLVALIVGFPAFVNLFWVWPWMGLGFYLHQTKALSIACVWTAYIRVWTGTDRWDADPEAEPIDTKMMNESLYAEFILETIPQLFIQAINNTAILQWSPLSIFSTVLSAFMALNGCYRFIYYTRFRGEQYTDVPLEISIGPCLPPQRLPNSTFIRRGAKKARGRFYPKRLLDRLDPNKRRILQKEMLGSADSKASERQFHIERTDGAVLSCKGDVRIFHRRIRVAPELLNQISIGDKVTCNDVFEVGILTTTLIPAGTIVEAVLPDEQYNVELSQRCNANSSEANLRFTQALLVFRLKDQQLTRDIERKLPEKEDENTIHLEEYTAYKIARWFLGVYYWAAGKKDKARELAAAIAKERDGDDHQEGLFNADHGEENDDWSIVSSELGGGGDAAALALSLSLRPPARSDPASGTAGAAGAVAGEGKEGCLPSSGATEDGAVDVESYFRIRDPALDKQLDRVRNRRERELSRLRHEHEMALLPWRDVDHSAYALQQLQQQQQSDADALHLRVGSADDDDTANARAAAAAAAAVAAAAAKEVAVAALKGLSSLLVMLTEDPHERMLREVRESKRLAEGNAAPSQVVVASGGSDQPSSPSASGAAGTGAAGGGGEDQADAAGHEDDPDYAETQAEQAVLRRRLQARQEAVHRATRERAQREAELAERRRQRLPQHTRAAVKVQVEALKQEEAKYRILRKEIQRAKLDRLQREERQRQKEKEREKDRERDKDRAEWDAVGAVMSEER